MYKEGMYKDTVYTNIIITRINRVYKNTYKDNKYDH